MSPPLSIDTRFHDAKLVGIETTELHCATLSFISDRDEPFQFQLVGVEHFRCDNFREGNIVFDCERVPADQISRREFEHLLGVRSGGAAAEIDKLMASITSNDLKFLRLSASYGAVVLVMCSDFKLICEPHVDAD